MKTVVLTNGSEHGLEIITQMHQNNQVIDGIILENKILRKKEAELFKSKLGGVQFLFNVIPFKNLLYRFFRKVKYNDVSKSQLMKFTKNVFTVDNLTSSKSEEILKTLSPDLIVLGGSRIIKENILNIPSIGTLNAHPGILPFYRGVDVVKWAVYNDDKVGVTVHFVDAGIDSGEICKIEEIEVVNPLSISALKLKAIKVAGDLMSSVIAELAVNGSCVTEQNDLSLGNYYTTMTPEENRKLEQKILKDEK